MSFFKSLFTISLLLCCVNLSAATLPPKIMVLGDSLSAAFGIPQESGWVALLQQRLKDQGYSHKVINASISGETSAGGLSRLHALLNTYQPNIVIVELGANDGLRGLSLKQLQDNLLNIINAAHNNSAKVLLIGMRLPPNYGPTYTELFFSTFQKVSNTANANLVPFLFEGLEQNRVYFQEDWLHPTTKAQPILLNNIWPHLKPLL